MSTSQAQNLPPLTKNFLIDSATIYDFLTNNLMQEKEEKSTKSKPTVEKLEDIYEAFKKISPEEKYYSAIRTILQNNDPTLKSQYSFNENKHLATEKALKLMENNFTDETIPKKLKTKIKNSLIENLMKHNKQINQNSTEIKKSINKKVRFLFESENPIENLNTKDIYTISRTNMQVNLREKQQQIYFCVDNNVINPTYPRTSHQHSFGIDIPIQNTITLQPGELKLLNSGIKLLFPPNTYGNIKSRSSTAKNGIQVFSGAIDRDFNDFIKILVKNENNHDITIKKGQYLAQVFIQLTLSPSLTHMDEIEILSERNKGAFGSTEQIVNKKPALTQTNDSTVKSYNCLNVNILNIADVNTNCENCNFTYSPMYIHLMQTGDCCKQISVTPPKIAQVDNILKNIKVFYNNVTIKQKSEEQEFLAKIVQKMAKMQALSKYDRKNAIFTAQINDEFCTLIKNEIKNNKNTRFVIKDTLLYKQRGNVLTLVIPDSIISLVIYELHVEIGHISKTSMVKIFNMLYYHPKSSRLIKTFVDNCHICLTQKPIENRAITLGTERTMKPFRPNSHFYMDVIPQPKSGKYSAFTLFTDAYSGYAIGYPIHEKNTNTVKESILHLFNSVGLCKYIYADNDVVILSAAKELIKDYDINFLTAAPYSQQQNNAESIYKQIKAKLNILCNGNDLQWPVALPLALSQVNNSIISRAKLSRYNIHFKDKSNVTVLDNFAEETIFEHSIDQWNKQKQLNKLKYTAKGLKVPTFEIGDIVISKDDVINPNVTTMLKPPNKEPARVLKINNRDVKLQCLITGKIYFSHMRKVRKMPLSEYLQKTRDIPVKGTINFKRTTPGTIPFSEALDPKTVQELQQLLQEEEKDNEDNSDSEKEQSKKSEMDTSEKQEALITKQDTTSEIIKSKQLRGRPKKSSINHQPQNIDTATAKQIDSSYNLRSRKTTF